MGLFDRIKKAFTGNNEKKEEKAKEVDQEVTDESADQVDTGSSTATTSENKSEEIKSPEKESDESKEDESAELEASKTTDPESETVEKSKDEPAPAPEINEQSQTHAEENEPVESNTEPVKSPITEETESQKSNGEESVSTDESVTEKPARESDNDGETEETEEAQAESDEASEVKEYDEGLKKSRTSFSARFNKFLANFRSVDEEFFDDLEELLIESDVGYETALRISDELREEVKLRNAKKRSDVSDVIVEKLVDMYDEEGKEEDNALHFSQDEMPTVFLFVGVNGAGKTTTIGKLAHRFQSEGKKVLLAAGDTFRAGAIEQLQRWGERVNVPVEAKAPQTDPASVVYDALHRAINEKFDILLVDTAGRLQNNQNLMRELEKIKRVISREIPEAPQEVLLVLDGSTGQNALSQAKQFKETTDVSGIVLTKLDGSSQGGIVLAIRNELHLPVKLVGLGEQMDDLRDFDAEKFIYGLFKDLIVGSGD